MKTENGTALLPRPPEMIIDDLETLKIYSDPLRRKILAVLMAQPRSAMFVAEQLNMPFTRLYYHLHLLEKHQLIRLVETRHIGGGVEEKYYQTAAEMFVVHRSLMTVGDVQHNEALEALIGTTLDTAASDIRRGAQAGTIDLSVFSPNPAALLLRHGALRLSTEQAQSFHTQLMELVMKFQNADVSPDAAFYGVLLAVYPGPEAPSE